MALHQTNPILKQAAIESASKAPVAPASNNLVAIQEALTSSTARIASSITELEQGRAETRIATTAITQAIGDITSATKTTRLAADTASLESQNATISAFEASGGSEIQAQLMGTLKEDNTRLATLLDEKQDIINDEFTGVQLIDGVINQFRSLQTDLEIRAAQGQLSQTEREISGITTATESFAQANALTRKTLNAGVIEANQKAIAAEGKLKSSQAEIQNINSNASVMAQLVQADARNVSNLIQGFRLEGEVEERELKRERIGFQREQMTFQREQWLTAGPAAKVALEQAELNLDKSKKLGPTQIATAEQRLADAQKRATDQINTEVQLVEAVQRGQSLSGIAIEEPESILFGLKQSGAQGIKYAKLQELGGVADPILGATPYEAGVSLATVAPSGNVTETPGTKALDAISELQAAVYKKAGKVPKEESARAADFNATSEAFMDSKAANIVAGDSTNPYQAPNMPVLIESFNSVATTELYVKVLKSMDMRETDPQRIMDAAIAGVRAGTISPEAAASGVETIFEGAAAYNNTMFGGFRRVGLQNQVTYNVQLKRPATLVERLKIGAKLGIDIAGPIATPSFFLGVIGIGEGDEQVFAKVDERLGSKTFSVDLMDRTKIQAAIVQLLSSTVPPKTTPIAEK